MTPLIRKHLVDRNGVLTTRNVRDAPAVSPARSALPAPSLGTAGKDAPAKVFKPRAKQLAVRERTYRASLSASKKRDPALATAHDDYDLEYIVRASDVQMYDVFSVIAPSDSALKVLCRGITSKDEALEYLRERGAEHLITDLGEMTQEALRHGVSAGEFMNTYRITHESDLRSPHLMDVMRFDSSSLGALPNTAIIRKDLFEGKFSFDLLSDIGITNLKKGRRLVELRDYLKALYAGETNHDAAYFKDILARANAEDLSGDQLMHVLSAVEHCGPEFVAEASSLKTVATTRRAFYSALGSHLWENKPERVRYAVRLHDLLGALKNPHDSTPFFDAGIPVEATAEVLSSGGGLREATAIHDEGVTNSLAGGWL